MLVLGLISLFLLINVLTAGAFLKILLPHKEQILGRILCLVGGFIANPFFHVGNTSIPYPSGDDALFATVASTIFAGLILRRTVKDMKWLLLLTLISWLVFWGIYKGAGIWMIYVAEKTYGMIDCAEFVDIGILKIQYNLFSPLFIIGALFALAGLLLTLLKIRMGW